ncbi:MAG: hypothetical protein ACE5R6_06275 [Candidatus Heimdallarchaeota archaeon]
MCGSLRGKGTLLLHWKTDPLLLDPEPVAHEAWVTANELLEQGKRAKLFLVADALNLYGIFVRKRDFVPKGRRDRILARMPYVGLDAAQVAFIRTHLDGIARQVATYFADAIPMDRTQARTRLQTYLRQRRLPFPLLRVAATFTDDPRACLATWLEGATFESFRRLPFRCPLRVTPALAYFLGVCDGDGSLTEKFIHVLGCSRKFTKRLLFLSAHLFGKTSKITVSQGYDVIFIKSKWVARLVHFLSDHPFGWKYARLRQPLILDDELACDYWRGAIDSDGTYVASITWATCSERYARDFTEFLAKKKIQHTLSQSEQPLNVVQIKVRSFFDFARHIGTWHPEKTKQLYRLLRDGTKVLLFNGPNSTTINDHGYFKLELLPKLHVEVHGRRILIRRMFQLLDVKAYDYLINNNARFVYPRADKAIKLPLRPSKEVNQILKYVTPTGDGLTVTTGKHRGLESIDFERTVHRVSELFGISSLRKSNGGYNARHKLIRDFLKTFYVYKKPWLAVSHSTFEMLKVKWNPIRWLTEDNVENRICFI